MGEMFRVSRSILCVSRKCIGISRMYNTAPVTKVKENTDFVPEPVPDFYKRVMEIFPENMEMAFAYGSAVFQQEGEKDFENKMLDFIFVVDDPKTWHLENMRRNKSHYSFIARFFKPFIGKMQKLGAGVYFNTDVPFENRKIKYGVISTKNLIKDLNDWNSLYVSGRLHKPVRFIKYPNNYYLELALDNNLKSAFHAALLMLPQYSSEMELYKKITSLSYTGDVRMMLAEDSNKVQKIVSGNIPRFRALYGDLLLAEQHLQWHRRQDLIEQNVNEVTRQHHLNLLPAAVINYLTRRHRGSNYNVDDMLRSLAHNSNLSDLVSEAVKRIVEKSSKDQSLKGLYMAGMYKSLVYVSRKVTKRFQ